MLKILIDTDPGVDDAIALLFALAHPQFEVMGITTVGGNVDLDHVTDNAAGLLYLAKRPEIPLVRGLQSVGRQRSEDVHGAGGLGGVNLAASGIKICENASQFIVETVRANPGDIRLIGIGPLTNIAEAIRLEPRLPQLAEGLSIMGGAEVGGNVTDWAEFNIWQDPLAGATVFAQDWLHLDMVGLDATAKAVLTPNVRELCYQFGLAGERIGTLIHDITRDYLNSYWARNRVLGCRIHDLLAVALLADPTISQGIQAEVSVQVGGVQDGRTIVKRGGGNVRVYTDSTDNDKLMRLTMTTLFPHHLDDISAVLDTGFTN